MDEKEFLYAIPETHSSLGNLENEFIATDKGHISRQEIRECAVDLAAQLEPVIAACQTPQEQYSVVVEFLTAQRLEEELNSVNQGAESTMDLNELEAYLHPIRRALLEELIPLLNLNIHMIAGQLADKVWALEDNKILKLPEPHPAEHDQTEAFRLLYSLPERSPYLTYQLLEAAPLTGNSEGAQVQRRLPIETLDVVLAQERPELQVSIGYVLDTMKGAQFLIDNGLRMTDFSPANVAINQNIGHAQLFDFDGLRLAGEAVEVYVARGDSYQPPERVPHQKSTPEEVYGPVQEAEMVYEFGKLLQDVFLGTSSNDPLQTQVRRISMGMLRSSPADRPPLAQIISDLEHLLGY